MKPSIVGALIALQLVTAGLVVGVLLKRNESGSEAVAEMTQRVERLAVGLEGALHRQAEIALHMDQLRQQWQSLPIPGKASDGTPAGGAAQATLPANGAPPADAPTAEATKPAVAAAPNSPFPLAAEALAALKHAVKARLEEQKANTRNLTPFDVELKKRRDELIARGHEAVYVVRREVDLQPFEAERDVDCVEYLLREVVPALSSNAKSDAFDIARSALVRATNEGSLKLAGAVALLQIEPDKWWKDVIDVITMGSPREATVRGQLLDLFSDHPRPEAVDVCRRILDEARYAPDLRNKAIFVIAKQSSAAVVPALRRVLFEEPSQLMRNHAFDSLWTLFENSPAERRKLLDEVLAADTAHMPEAVRVKATTLREELEKKAAAAGQ